MNTFSAKFYFNVLAGIIKEPRRFFRRMSQDMNILQPLGFIVVSGVLFSIACSVSDRPDNRFIWGSVCFLNAVGMVVLSSCFGYLIMTMMVGKRATFKTFFSVFSFASGATLLVSWMPFFLWITELWKWWLVGTGMTQACGLSHRQAWIIIGLTIAALFLFFKSVLPMVVWLK